MSRYPEFSTSYGLVGDSDDLPHPSNDYLLPPLPEIAPKQHVPRRIARASFTDLLAVDTAVEKVETEPRQ